MKTFNRILFVVLFLTAGAAAIFAIIEGNAILAWVITMCIVGYAVWLAFDILYCQLKRLLFELPIFLWMLNEEHKYTEADLVQFGFLDHDLMSEAGDILWQLAGLCKVMGWDFNDVGQANLNGVAIPPAMAEM